MFAVFESGGKQHRVAEGDVLDLEKLPSEVGDSIEFENILMVSNDNGVQVGEPYLDGAKIRAEVLSQDRTKKVKVLKFKRRKNYLRNHGHRQHFTKVRITAIST